MEPEPAWIGSRLGYPLLVDHAPPGGDRIEWNPARPWWVFQRYARWQRQDGLWAEAVIARPLTAPSWKAHWDKSEEVLAVFHGDEAPLDLLDRRFPMPRPVIRAGQIWAFPNGEKEPSLFVVPRSGAEAFEWLDRELVRRADAERVDRLLAGWCLVSGPGAPWADTAEPRATSYEL